MLAELASARLDVQRLKAGLPVEQQAQTPVADAQQQIEQQAEDVLGPPPPYPGVSQTPTSVIPTTPSLPSIRTEIKELSKNVVSEPSKKWSMMVLNENGQQSEVCLDSDLG